LRADISDVDDGAQLTESFKEETQAAPYCVCGEEVAFGGTVVCVLCGCVWRKKKEKKVKRMYKT